MMAINHEHLDSRANISHQISKRLEMLRDVGLVKEDEMMWIFGEWVVQGNVDCTLAIEASEYLEEVSE